MNEVFTKGSFKIKNAILSKIRNRSAKVAVFGLGHVGLLNAAVIADNGFQVVGVDPNSKIVEAVSEGRVDVYEPGLSDLIKRVAEGGILRVTSTGSVAVKEAEVVVVCVPTPIKEDRTPDLSYIEDACKTVARSLNVGKLVIVESTVPPKTTKTFIAPMLEEVSGLRCGLDFWLAYCPERVTPGKALEEIVENDRVVGGYNAESAEIAAEFFRAFVQGQVFVTDAETTEAAKLAENTFRDVNIAFANELALICEEIGLDVSEVIRLSNTHPRVSIHKPGPGVGGPCLPKDPYLMLFPAESEGFKSKVVRASRMVNDFMPKHIVGLILRGLREVSKDIVGARIAVLGTAYKANVDDPRMSPSGVIIHKLKSLGTTVAVYDPYCKEDFGARRVDSVKRAVKNADCVIIATDHDEFKDINLSEIRRSMNSKPIIVDGRRILNPREAEKHGFKYYGVGFGEGG